MNACSCSRASALASDPCGGDTRIQPFANVPRAACLQQDWALTSGLAMVAGRAGAGAADVGCHSSVSDILTRRAPLSALLRAAVGSELLACNTTQEGWGSEQCSTLPQCAHSKTIHAHTMLAHISNLALCREGCSSQGSEFVLESEHLPADLLRFFME